ncbi:MAG: hypothetical protein ACE5NP_13805 [Anaerolineae bacterium]
MEFVDVPTEVEAHFSEDGRVTPRSFTWQGETLHISAVGRRRVEEEGAETVHYFLVMVDERWTFELRLEPSNLCWRVTRVWGQDKGDHALV